MAVIKTEHLTYVYSPGTPYEKTAVDDVSVEIEQGAFVGVIGHTGSGKSTFIQHLNGLLTPTRGKVLIDGEDLWADKTQLRRLRFKVGLVFQYPEYQLFEETVRKDIAFGPKNMGKTGKELDDAVFAAATFCGLDTPLFDKSPFELSGGQKRRVAIAGVVAMNPDVLVLDEPAAGLDPAGREEIIGGLLRYRKQRGSTMVIISHSMEDIAKYSDYIVVLDHGRVCMQGTPAEVFMNAEALFGASLDLPQVTKLFVELKKRLLADSTDVYTVKEGVRRITALIENRRKTGEADA